MLARTFGSFERSLCGGSWGKIELWGKFSGKNSKKVEFQHIDIATPLILFLHYKSLSYVWVWPADASKPGENKRSVYNLFAFKPATKTSDLATCFNLPLLLSLRMFLDTFMRCRR